MNEEKKRKLKLTTNILGIIIILILPILNMKYVAVGIILGLLLSLREICFGDNFIENAFKNEGK